MQYMYVMCFIVVGDDALLVVNGITYRGRRRAQTPAVRVIICVYLLFVQ